MHLACRAQLLYYTAAQGTLNHKHMVLSSRLNADTVPALLPAAAGESLASKLVEAELAACVNIVPGLTSVYRWGPLQRHLQWSWLLQGHLPSAVACCRLAAPGTSSASLVAEQQNCIPPRTAGLMCHVAAGADPLHLCRSTTWRLLLVPLWQVPGQCWLHTTCLAAASPHA
jgi:hypothetical protein